MERCVNCGSKKVKTKYHATHAFNFLKCSKCGLEIPERLVPALETVSEYPDVILDFCEKIEIYRGLTWRVGQLIWYGIQEVRRRER